MPAGPLVAQIELGIVLVAVAAVVVVLFMLDVKAQERVNRGFGISQFNIWVRQQPFWRRFAIAVLLLLLALFLIIVTQMLKAVD